MKGIFTKPILCGDELLCLLLVALFTLFPWLCNPAPPLLCLAFQSSNHYFFLDPRKINLIEILHLTTSSIASTTPQPLPSVAHNNI
jgi:hypothetical protein